jgi:MFS family permease
MSTTAQAQPVKAAAASFVGTALEWYDFYIYGFASALVFARLFFPGESEFLKLMASFATFAIGFIVRPLGAVIFGHFGDKFGRQKTLVVTLFVMGIATICIGCLPTYNSIGILAPILLIVLRIFQGLAVGGDWGGAVLIAAEHAPAKHRIFYASFAQWGSPVALICATLIFGAISKLPEEDLFSYGWRIPFLVSFFLIIAGIVIRRSVQESPIFLENARRESEKVRLPVKEVFTKVPKLLVLTIGANIMGVGGYYFTNTFMTAYTTQYLGISRDVILSALFFVALCQFIVQPIAAYIGERVGPHRWMLFATAGSVIVPYIMYPLVNTGNFCFMTLGICLAIVMICCSYAVIAGYMTKLYAPQYRYTGISLGFQLCGAVFASITPMLGTTLAEYFQGQWLPLAFTYSVYALIGFTCIWFLGPKHTKLYED